MQDPQTFGFVDVRLAFVFGQQLPTTAEFLGNFGVVFVGRNFDDFSTFQLRPNHEGVHRSFDVIDFVFFRLQKNNERHIMDI